MEYLANGEVGTLEILGKVGKFGMLGKLGIPGEVRILGEVRIEYLARLEYLVRLNMILGRFGILDEVEYLVVFGAIRGWPGSAVGPGLEYLASEILGKLGILGKFGIHIYIVAPPSVLDLLSSFAFPWYGSICVLTQLYCPSCLASPAFPCLDPLPPRRPGRPRRLSLRITRNIALRRYISSQTRGAGKRNCGALRARGDIELVPTTIPLI